MYDPHKHNRRSNRLKGYNYARLGYYFITICVADRYCLFGKIVDDCMILNGYGRIANKEWHQTENLRDRDNVRLDEFVVMPNHVHGIIELTRDRGVLNTPLSNSRKMNLNRHQTIWVQ